MEKLEKSGSDSEYKNPLKIYIYNFKNSLTGLIVEPVSLQ